MRLVASTEQEEKILHLLEPLAQARGLVLVRVRLSGQKKISIQIMIDKMITGADPKDHKNTVTLSDCEAFSKRAMVLLGAETSLGEDYQLEISSPGIERPLTRLEDFNYFKHSLAHIKLHHAWVSSSSEAFKQIQGQLLGVQEDHILIQQVTTGSNQEALMIPFHNVKEARLIMDQPPMHKRKERESQQG